MKHLGDITKINGHEIEPVHCITFGSPCQDLSVANGNRKGLDGNRSGLFMEAIRIVKEMREKTNGVYPNFLIWENVPGAFSSNFRNKEGGDFRCVLEEFARISEPDATIPGPEKRWEKAGYIAGNGWSCAWRVLDAQYHGVPQRRRRIAAVVDLHGDRAGDVLFEYFGKPIPSDRKSSFMDSGADMEGGSQILAQQKSVSGDTYKSIEAWKGSARDPKASTGGHDCVPCRMITERAGKPGGGKGILESVDLAGPLRAQYKDTLFEPVYCIQGDIARGAHFGQNGVGVQEDVSYTLNTMDVHAVCYSGYSVTSPQNQINVKEGDPCHSLTSDSRNAVVDPETNGTLQEKESGTSLNLNNVVIAGYNGCLFQPKSMMDENWEQSDIKNAIRSGESKVSHAVVFCMATGQANAEVTENVSPTLNCNHEQPIVFDSRGNGDGKTVPTITGDHENRVTDYTAVCVQNTGQGWWNESDIGATVRTPCGGDSTKANLVCCLINDQGGDVINVEKGDVSPTLRAESHNHEPVIIQRIIRWIVRRLTPTECGRLQGYPDGWCEIGEWVDSKGKLHKDTDTPKYKAFGNSIACPVFFYVVQKMKPYLPEGAKLGSLFDGIGGFPLVWEETYGKGTAMWASEIEEFPIAVTKCHFPEEIENGQG